jgi:hypothetical protein
MQGFGQSFPAVLASSVIRHSDFPEHLLDRRTDVRQLTRLFLRSYHVQNLQCYGIENDARQRHPSARLGEKEGRCGPARHKKCAAHFRAKPATSTDLGTGAKEVCARSRYSARSEDNKQTRCV